MATNYQAVRQENERRYGTDISRIGHMLLADRYADRTHFIFELLQNAEDALAKRTDWRGCRSVRFEVSDNALQVSHFGKAFDEADVRGICGIAESTKDLTAIGRFGIGFKSVYAFTERPEIHSGDERFAIESFVWPVPTAGISRDSDATIVVLPLREPSGRIAIEAGLKRLGPASLLFLRAIDEIEWKVVGGPSGLYLRSKPDRLADSVRRVAVLGQTSGAAEVEESWLLFSKPVSTPQGNDAGQVEVAFRLSRDNETGRERLRPVPRSQLVVYFPTVCETGLGFVVQGPYRTTPSRDNVPVQDEWNRHCVAETVVVLQDALKWLRDNDYLDADALNCLPLERAKFPDTEMFAPIFGAVRRLLLEDALLPRHQGGHVSATQARIARTQQLRDLLSPAQLASLLDAPHELAWLSGDISPDRMPILREYLTTELQVEEIRPETLLTKLNKTFLEAQSDEWVRRLYEYLGELKRLHIRARELPLVRLADGRHVRAHADGRPQAYLPAAVATGYPTVRADVCNTDESLGFLKILGVAEPDLVDDVIVNVLPRYSTDGGIQCGAETYADDIARMLRAYRTDSESRRAQLVARLRDVPFVACKEQRALSSKMARPGDAYLATERLTQLFAGVEGVLIVDDGCVPLKGEDVRTLLVACGGHRYLEPIPSVSTLDATQRTEIRRKAGLERASWEKPIADLTLRGLSALLKRIEELGPEERRARSMSLWDALADLEQRQGSSAFLGTYSWSYSHETKTARFDAAFVRLLNEAAWITDTDGTLRRPSEIIFETLSWKSSPFLLSKIRFKPRELDQFARASGFEPGALDLLLKLGITSEADVRARLGLRPESSSRKVADDGSADADHGTRRDSGRRAPTVPDPAASGLGRTDIARADGEQHITVAGAAHTTASRPVSPSARGTEDQQQAGHADSIQGGRGSGARAPEGVGSRLFVSYVGTHPDGEESDPDDLEQGARMALEEKAIALILKWEPLWQRTPPDNPGFDLFQLDADGQPHRWCEVKAMTSSLDDRPVGLSHTQFDFAREHGLDYWLYIVERAGQPDATVVRIQDPAGKARTFTFDHGWRAIAEVNVGHVERPLG